MTEARLLSIIITAYTSERLNDIYELLKSIKNQNYTNIETLFVVEGSPELKEKISAYGIENAIPNLKMLFNSGEPGLSAARNVGIKEARGEIIAFVDDDVLLYPDWAENMVKAYTDDTIIGVTGPAIPMWEDKSMSWFPEEFYWIISCTAWDSDNRVKEIRNAWGMNMSFKREAFEKAGVFSNKFGFHKGPMAEDNEFSQRIKEKTGKKILFEPDVKLWHKVHKYRLSQKFIKERSYWIGYSRRMIKQTNRLNHKTDTNLLSQENRLLNRIFTRLFPDIIKKIFTKPVIAWRTIRVTITALTYVALGYYSNLLPGFLKRKF
jgi:glucosyl-dolichyl phosphate glucuronosyltransferase